MQSFHLGIDVAKAKLDCALRLPDGKLRSKVVENNFKDFKVLTEWLEKHGATIVHVCMEATGVYWEAVAEYLATQRKESPNISSGWMNRLTPWLLKRSVTISTATNP